MTTLTATYLHNKAIGLGLGLVAVLAIGLYLVATSRDFRYAVRATVLWMVGR